MADNPHIRQPSSVKLRNGPYLGGDHHGPFLMRAIEASLFLPRAVVIAIDARKEGIAKADKRIRGFAPLSETPQRLKAHDGRQHSNSLTLCKPVHLAVAGKVRW